MNIKMVLSDLDGTLLNGERELTLYTQQVLETVMKKGIIFVPATGRPYKTLPLSLKQMPSLKYAILANGAQVFDCVQQKPIYQKELALEDAKWILNRLNEYPVLVECFLSSGRIYMEERFFEHMERWVPSPTLCAPMRQSRTPVKDLWHALCCAGESIQKIHVYTGKSDLREQMMPKLAEEFPYACVSCSVPGNIEITHHQATKGEAMLALCAYLGISPGDVMAFGDERNDRTMLEYAGIGVAMADSLPEIRACADFVAGRNTEDAVAHVLNDKILEGTLHGC